MSLQAGSRIGRYEILSPLGAGGMGEVYLARDLSLGRSVAIKTLPEHLAKDPQAVARFEREARAIAALSHPNILAIHDFGSAGDVTFAVTELLEGETLRSRLARGTMSLERAIEIGATVAEGLAAAHAKGVTHRDIKPENIFLTRESQAKILDFGLAFYRPVADEATSLPTETEPGMVMGTLGYMSPEQVRGERVGPASDIFSLGAVLYEMVTGRRAFARTTPGETLAAILRDDPQPAEAGAEMDTLIARCLAKEPARRFSVGSGSRVCFADECWTTAAEVEPTMGSHRHRGRHCPAGRHCGPLDSDAQHGTDRFPGRTAVCSRRE